MEKLKKTGDLSEEETGKLLKAMSALEQNVKDKAGKSIDEGIKKGGSGEKTRVPAEILFL